MDTWLSWLLFAGLFYLMMRYGCGMHAMHRHGGHGRVAQRREASDRKDVDPVCGMDVAPDTGYVKIYEGGQYRLCSRNCLDAFDANPQQYARAPDRTAA